jgi:excisionase family DNA binding protein
MSDQESEGCADQLSARQVASRLGISVRTLWRMLRRGGFPAPIRYNRKLVRWRSADVDRFIQSRQT